MKNPEVKHEVKKNTPEKSRKCKKPGHKLIRVIFALFFQKTHFKENYS
jgi:hypothetical protein